MLPHGVNPLFKANFPFLHAAVQPRRGPAASRRPHRSSRTIVSSARRLAQARMIDGIRQAHGHHHGGRRNSSATSFETVRSGLAAAKARGIALGGHTVPAPIDKTAKEVLALHREGLSYSVGLSKTTDIGQGQA